MSKLLTVPEIAKCLRVSRTTVWRWCHNKKLPAFRVGKNWRVYQADVEKMVGHPLDILDESKPNT